MVPLVNVVMADHSESAHSTDHSGGKGTGGGSDIPPARPSATLQPALTLQDSQLDLIVQRVVDKLKVPAPVCAATLDQGAAVSDQSKRQRRRTRALSSSSSDNEASRSAGRVKRQKVTKGKRPVSKIPKGRSSASVRGLSAPAISSDPWASMSSDSSGSSEEEGELSGSDNEGAEITKNRLFPLEFFPRLMGKAIHTLGLQSLPIDKAEGKDAHIEASKFFPSSASDRSLTVPLPHSFKQIIENEWREPSKPRRVPRSITRLYGVSGKDANFLKIPSVDQPVAALASSSVILTDGDNGPRDPCDRRIESALKKGFDASALALRSASATSVMARASLAWVEDFQKAAGKLPKETRNLLKKLSLATSFMADSTQDSLQFAAKAMASNVVARRSVWLRHWEVDQGSQSRLAAFPFMGEKLFGQTLDPLLVENKDKRKVLPTNKRDFPKQKPASFFRPRSSFRSRDSLGRKPKWNKNRFFQKGKGRGGGETSTSGGSSFKQKTSRTS